MACAHISALEVIQLHWLYKNSHGNLIRKNLTRQSSEISQTFTPVYLSWTKHNTSQQNSDMRCNGFFTWGKVQRECKPICLGINKQNFATCEIRKLFVSKTCSPYWEIISFIVSLQNKKQQHQEKELKIYRVKTEKNFLLFLLSLV